MILLVTNKRDLTTDYIVRELKGRSIPFYRLNTEELPKLSCTIGHKDVDDWKIDSLHGNIVTAAYFRRPGVPHIDCKHCSNGEQEYMKSEWLAFLKSIYTRLDTKWLNSPTNIVLAEDKPRQLLIAANLGFRIPEGIVTNSVNDVLVHTDNNGLIAKPLRSALIEGDEEKVIFTNRIPSVTHAEESAISRAPVIFQQEVPKKFDVRVTVIGNKIFPVAIWSQVSNETEVDWRRGGRIDLKHQSIELPNELSGMCLELVRQLNLSYGAIDLICDTAGDYWFLEINPNGQWAWIENQTSVPIAASIVDELLSIGK